MQQTSEFPQAFRRRGGRKFFRQRRTQKGGSSAFDLHIIDEQPQESHQAIYCSSTTSSPKHGSCSNGTELEHFKDTTIELSPTEIEKNGSAMRLTIEILPPNTNHQDQELDTTGVGLSHRYSNQRFDQNPPTYYRDGSWRNKSRFNEYPSVIEHNMDSTVNCFSPNNQQRYRRGRGRRGWRGFRPPALHQMRRRTADATRSYRGGSIYNMNRLEHLNSVPTIENLNWRPETLRTQTSELIPCHIAHSVTEGAADSALDNQTVSDTEMIMTRFRSSHSIRHYGLSVHHPLRLLSSAAAPASPPEMSTEGLQEVSTAVSLGRLMPSVPVTVSSDTSQYMMNGLPVEQYNQPSSCYSLVPFGEKLRKWLPVKQRGKTGWANRRTMPHLLPPAMSGILATGSQTVMYSDMSSVIDGISDLQSERFSQQSIGSSFSLSQAQYQTTKPYSGVPSQLVSLFSLIPSCELIRSVYDQVYDD